MKRTSSADFVRNFSTFCDDARLEPVLMTRNGRPRLVVTSVEDYRAMISLALLAADAGEDAHKLGKRLAEVA